MRALDSVEEGQDHLSRALPVRRHLNELAEAPFAGTAALREDGNRNLGPGDRVQKPQADPAALVLERLQERTLERGRIYTTISPHPTGYLVTFSPSAPFQVGGTAWMISHFFSFNVKNVGAR